MATITLYAGKINQMPGLINEVKKSVVDYKSELSALRKKTLNINRSVCNLDEVISSIQASSQTQATLPNGNVVSGDIVPALADFTDPVTQLALIGLVITVVLMLLKVRGAILWGIMATTVIGLFMGITPIPELTASNFCPRQYHRLS